MKLRCVIAMGLLLTASTFAADNKDNKPAKKPEDPKHRICFTDPAKAGIDYTLQGEYEGSAGSAKWAHRSSPWAMASFMRF